MRPLIKNNRPKENPLQKAWTTAERMGTIEKFQEEQVFDLTPNEAKKCRYIITDMDRRIAECTVHTKGFTHGLRLHPPHLYKLEDGIVYYKNSSGWVRWFPNFSENQKRNLDNN